MLQLTGRVGIHFIAELEAPINKLLEENVKAIITANCSLPLTGKGVVNLILTDLALITVEKEGLVLREIAPDVDRSEVIEKTDATLIIAPDIKEMFSN